MFRECQPVFGTCTQNEENGTSKVHHVLGNVDGYSGVTFTDITVPAAEIAALGEEEGVLHRRQPDQGHRPRSVSFTEKLYYVAARSLRQSTFVSRKHVFCSNFRKPKRECLSYVGIPLHVGEATTTLIDYRNVRRFIVTSTTHNCMDVLDPSTTNAVRFLQRSTTRARSSIFA